MIRESNVLVLEILRQDSQLAMSIFAQKELASTLRQYGQRPISFAEINKLCQEVIAILNQANKIGVLEPDSMHSLKKTGQLLWDHLLTKPVKDTLKTTQISDLVLSIDEELVSIPWELLYTGEDFLCLKFNLGRLVRTRQAASLPQYRSLSSKLKMLILVNPTSDLKSAYSEGLYIKNRFDKIRNKMNIDFKSQAISAFYVKKNLHDYDIVHFAGHCEYSAHHPKNTGWVLSDGIFSCQDILALGETLSLPSLIFSHACHSAEVSPDLLDAKYQTRTYSVAAAFLFSGVRHYLGTICKIEDTASITFAEEFYAQLIGSKSVGECVRLSRLKLVRKYGLASIFWMSYLLYGDPNFVLLRSAAKPAIAKPKRDLSLYKKYLKKLVLAISIIFILIYLYMWLPTRDPNTYILFLKAQKLFSRGDNQEVIALTSRIMQKDPQFMAVYPLLADTYQRLGKQDKALEYYFVYELLAEKRHDKKNLASAYLKIGWHYHLQEEYAKAFDFYQKALALSQENKDKLNEAIGLRKLAVWHIDKKDYHQALELLMKSSEINRARQHIYEHRYSLACDYFDLGLVFSDENDSAAAKEFYDKSRLLFEKLKLKKELSDYYFNLGEIYLFEKQYQKAFDCYKKGLSIDQAQGNKTSIASDYNMIGELYVAMDNLTDAEDFFKKSELMAKQINAQPELAAAYYNLGLLYKKIGRKNKARDYLRQAQEIYSLIDPATYQEIKQELLSLDNI